VLQSLGRFKFWTKGIVYIAIGRKKCEALSSLDDLPEVTFVNFRPLNGLPAWIHQRLLLINNFRPMDVLSIWVHHRSHLSIVQHLDVLLHGPPKVTFIINFSAIGWLARMGPSLASFINF